eukprot:TRINITY_DN81546_c0_g1_i1.p1 TRINITY_DN81546_c0_g1~~TRINITY_DN81546_c0_g1_i1.p1  ORF type:complete len:530 (-),score=88.38 TRINITY_DN81546_c0_g1_i1:37-1626(-)
MSLMQRVTYSGRGYVATTLRMTSLALRGSSTGELPPPPRPPPPPSLASQNANLSKDTARSTLHATPNCGASPQQQPIQHRRLGKPLPATQSVVASQQQQMAAEDITYALLVDGDCQGSSRIQAALRALRSRGSVVYGEVFAVAPRKEEKQLANLLKAENLMFKEVPRKAGGTKGPNDIEIAMRAVDLANSGSADCIALLVADVDFVLVARRLTSHGQRAAVLLDSNRVFLAKAFEEVGAEVITLSDDIKSGRPLKMAVLNPDGGGAIVTMGPREHAQVDVNSDVSEVVPKLRELSFLEDEADPPVPAIAKFWFTNSLGPLAVWPPQLAYFAFKSLMSDHKERGWQTHTHELCFVLPHDNVRPAKSKSALADFGTGRCRGIATGGGPFMLADSPELPEKILRRLGYLDDGRNTDFDEALSLFCSIVSNKRLLLSVDAEFADARCSDRRLKFRRLMLSGKTYGHWQIAPSFNNLGDLLASKGLVSSQATSSDIFEAMQLYADMHGISSKKTYNSLAYCIQNHLKGSQATSR